MKIMLAPGGIMAWGTHMKPNGDNIYLNAAELEYLIQWLDTNRNGFIEDALAKERK